jgi:hypothetical protein
MQVWHLTAAILLISELRGFGWIRKIFAVHTGMRIRQISNKKNRTRKQQLSCFFSCVNSANVPRFLHQKVPN